MELVPSRNIVGGVGHRQILGNVYEEQIEALVSCRQGVHTRTTYPNLQLKFHEKTRAMKKKNKLKGKNLKNDEMIHTNFGNELRDVGICWKGTFCKLRIQHVLHHVHIFYEGKFVRRLRRCDTRIQESGLPCEVRREKKCHSEKK
jgi:hypothetical protein